MSENTPKPDDDLPEGSPLASLLKKTAALNAEEPPAPSNKPLQIFLLIALVITGAAYVSNQWIELSEERARTRLPSRLHEKVKSQSLYLKHTDAGKSALEAKHPDLAVAEFRRALDANQSAEGHENLGAALLQEGDIDAAFAQFKESVRMDAKFMPAYESWGQALLSEGKPDEAAEVYRMALQSNPDSGLIHFDLAMTLQQMQRDAVAASRAAETAGRLDEAAAAADKSKAFGAEALQHYTKASILGVDSTAFWAGYGELLNDAGRFSDAKNSLNRALAKDPDLAKAHFQLARAEAQLGQYGEAIGDYGKVLGLTPDNPQVLNNLALLYATATNGEVRSPKMAVQLATRACDATASQNARFLDTLARAYAADGDFFQAISWEEKALKRARQLGDEALRVELQPRFQRYMDHKAD